MNNQIQKLLRVCPQCNSEIEYCHRPSFENIAKLNKNCFKCIDKYKSSYSESFCVKYKNFCTKI